MGGSKYNVRLPHGSLLEGSAHSAFGNSPVPCLDSALCMVPNYDGWPGISCRSLSRE